MKQRPFILLALSVSASATLLGLGLLAPAQAGGGGAPPAAAPAPAPVVTPAPAPTPAPADAAATPETPPAPDPAAAAATQEAAAPAAPFQASPLAEHPGWRLASACFACHGLDGKDETFGALNIYSKEDFIERMNELKTTEEDREALMKPHSAGYTDAQIELMADYFSQIE